MAITLHPLLWTPSSDLVGLWDIYHEKTQAASVTTSPGTDPGVKVSLNDMAGGTQAGALNESSDNNGVRINSAELIALIREHPHRISSWYGYNHIGQAGSTVTEITPTLTYNNKTAYWDGTGYYDPWPSPVNSWYAAFHFAEVQRAEYNSFYDNVPLNGEIGIVRVYSEFEASIYRYHCAFYRHYFKPDVAGMTGSVPSNSFLSKATVTVAVRSGSGFASSLNIGVIWDRNTLASSDSTSYSDQYHPCILARTYANADTVTFSLTPEALEDIEYARTHSAAIYFVLLHSNDYADYVHDRQAQLNYNLDFNYAAEIMSISMKCYYNLLRPTVTTADASSITTSGATLGGEVTHQGSTYVTERGVVWSYSNATPTTSDNKDTNGSGSGTFSEAIGGMTAGTYVYFRAYAINTGGTSYGTVKTFTTTASATPTVVNYNHYYVTYYGATVYGNVTDQGGSACDAKGVVWSTSNTNPTVGGANCTYASAGSGTGNFNYAITGYNGGTLVYYNVYAHNNSGYSYGAAYYFTTVGYTAPSVSTYDATSVTDVSAMLNGEVVADNGESIDERGFVWCRTSLNSNPLIGGSYVNQNTVSGTIGTFNYGATTSIHQYNYKAYAINSGGTSYGAKILFQYNQDNTPPPGIPSVSVSAVDNIGDTTARGNGQVTDDGGESNCTRGFCWSHTNAVPNKDDDSYCTAATTGEGAYTANMTGLTPSTSYYVRAWAINSVGTAYSDNVATFTTLPTDY